MASKRSVKRATGLAGPGLASILLLAAAGAGAQDGVQDGAQGGAQESAKEEAAPAPQDERLTNPLLGQPEAIAEGRRIYRSRCVVCHGRSGGRGPNLFATELDDEAFLETVIQGRRTMPALGLRMSPEDVWAVHAYVKSTDHYE